MTYECSLRPCGDDCPQDWLSKAERLYLDVFPPEERRPWTDIAAPRLSDGPRLLFVASGAGVGDFAGFVTLWDFGTFVYIEHFAIESSLRGHGTGAQVLALLRDMLARPIVLEAEPVSDDNPMAARRIAFYCRNGFALLDHDYVQPPYQAGLPSVPLRLMSTDAGISPAEVERVLHKRVYGV
ncbi:MAG: GNAT family N-acetyltransferase [Muribaculaceae bacterium]|nr:GNAT family N-acetyltransferase [Muribaculaceae bacterium]